MHARAGVAAVLLAATVSGCAARGFVPPAGPATPAPDAAALFAAATGACRSVESLTAEAALAGRVNRRRVRGRLHLGLTSAGHIRLEALAPFGQPLFTLAGDKDQATLFLSREAQVVRDAPPAQIVEALAGVPLSPTDLLSIATGCLGAGQSVARAERFSSGLVHVSTEGGVDVWAKPAGSSFRPVAAGRGDVLIEYLEYQGDEPAVLRIVRRAAPGNPEVDLRVSFSQRERNARLDPSAFRLEVPADAKPVSIEELRRSGLPGS